MKLFRSLSAVVAVVVAIAIVVALVLVFTQRGGTRTVVADFPRTIALYQGSEVKIMGVKVGAVDSITPIGTKVQVRFHYDDQYKVPADAKAVVISPSIVGDRFVQLIPGYQGGPVLQNNAHLGLDRTGAPLELDQIFGSINSLDKALGPHGANKSINGGPGALSRLLDSTARNFGGQGVQFNQTLRNLGKLTQTLADNKHALFGSAAQIEKFVNALSRNDRTVRRFADSLASGSAMLSSDRQDLAAAVHNLAVAMHQVRGFVHSNRGALSRNIHGLTQISNTIVKRRRSLNEILTDAPAALNNLALTYDKNTGTLDTRDNVGELGNQLKADPTGTLCAFLDLPGLTKGGIKCHLKNGNGRAAPFGEGHRHRQNFDPTLAGLAGGRR